MPRRVHEAEVRLPPKKIKVIEEPPSLDVSFCDDEALPPGIVFTDVLQKKWRIGKPIGRGSFGRIYLASDETDKEVTKLNARYVVKIEPHSNGPLFVEVHCLIRTAQVSKVKAWCQQNKQKRLGMPVYIASGSFTDENTSVKYRFLVLPRYDVDLQKIISRAKVLDKRNVLIIALQILDVLEYLHNQGYTHSDIKSSNLMLGFDGNKFNKMPKPPPSYQKDNKQLVLLSRKHKKTKTNKSRTSNYYDDEDFIVRDNRSSLEGLEDNDKRLASVKKKLRKILSDKDSRTLHRHHAFNLRQLSNYVNYEDLNSSVCSDQSYQKLLDDFGNKNLIYASRKIHELNGMNIKEINDVDLDEIHKEAVLGQSNGQVYLLDYGLASKFLDSNGNHKDFGMDARKAHDGTLEYSSRDSHIGAHSRRSDLETLGYNLLDWLTGTLPWKTTEVLAEPDLVHVLKKNFMNDIKLLLKTCFKTEFYPQFMEKYLQYVTSLDFTDRPDYDYCRSLFRTELLKSGYPHDKDLSVNFAEPPMSPMSRKLCYAKRFGRKNTPTDFLARNGIKKAYERENICSFENDLKLELLKQTLNTSSEGLRKPCTSRNFFISDADLVARLKKSLMPHDIFGKKLSPKMLRSKKKNITQRKGVRRHRNSIGKFGKFMGSDRQFTWAEILAGNPEHIIRKERNPTSHDKSEEDDDSTCKYRIRKLSNASSEISESNSQSLLLQKDYFQNMIPTYAMKEVVANLKRRINGKITKDLNESDPALVGYTPAMVKVYKMKEKREAKEKVEAIKNLNVEKQVPNTRCTRSMTNKAKQIQPKQNKLKEKPSNVNKEIVSDIDENETQKSPKTKKSTTKSLRNSKKDVEQIETPKSTAKVVKRTVRKRQVPINRRRLRSSKRKKQ
ncbi:uncharacterized protein LOC125073904 [Vanessa atalanta]|uniref:uncharacterized protein LOC125073904 n=1 Tax=Vanessa atalanta TaxID=42275 RepID=UPI001FCD8E25|nr:uncharacterized protein LOC125073904 [Vanessa atalanta]XP_047540955.1 uncharacterized protein LOC125073904 [Vanessa atalanta]